MEAERPCQIAEIDHGDGNEQHHRRIGQDLLYRPSPAGPVKTVPQSKNRLSLLPPRRSIFVAVACLDPCLGAVRLFELPERRPRLQIIHKKCAGLERSLPVSGLGRSQHNVLAWLQPSKAMNDERSLERPAPACFGLDCLQSLL